MPRRRGTGVVEVRPWCGGGPRNGAMLFPLIRDVLWARKVPSTFSREGKEKS